MSDLELMQKIKGTYGALLTQACSSSSVPASFLAALIANESGGDPLAKRFEPRVLLDLWEVLVGRKAAYGSISRTDLVGFVSGVPAQPVQVPASLPADTYQRLDSLATSAGLTQIMGYNLIPLDPIKLRDPDFALHTTIKMLAQFAYHFQLDLAGDFEELLRCWNSGRPDGKTFDPNYVPNALARKVAYEALP